MNQISRFFLVSEEQENSFPQWSPECGYTGCGCESVSDPVRIRIDIRLMWLWWTFGAGEPWLSNTWSRIRIPLSAGIWLPFFPMLSQQFLIHKHYVTVCNTMLIASTFVDLTWWELFAICKKMREHTVFMMFVDLKKWLCKLLIIVLLLSAT